MGTKTKVLVYFNIHCQTTTIKPNPPLSDFGYMNQTTS